MAHGGKRANSGRPKGSTNQNSKLALDQIKDKIKNQDIMAPIEILMEVAHIAYGAAIVTLKKQQRFDKDMFHLATDAASKAAPYLHAKLVESKTEITSLKRPDQMTDEELEIFAGNPENSESEK